MTTPELLTKLNDFFQSKTGGKVSKEILDILPESSPISEQIQKLGVLDHIGKQVEAISEEGLIVDLSLDGQPLLNSPTASYSVNPINKVSFEITFKARTYKILGLEHKKNRLNCTVRLELADKLHIDSLNLYQSNQRSRLIQDICQSFQFPAHAIRNDFQAIVKTAESYSFDDVQKNKEMSEEEKQQALNFGQSPKLFEEILRDYEKLGSVGEENNKLITYLCAVSRLFEKPLSVMVISSSGAGKSELVTKTLNFMPDDSVIQLTSLSAKALFYKDEDSLKAKILSLEEDAGGDTASYAIRQLISSSALTVESTIRDQLDGKIKTQQNTVNCQTSVFITSTNPDTDPETKSRFFILHVDESEQQTQRIIDLQKHSRSLAALADKVDSGVIINKHQNLQSLLKSYPIVNPYIEHLSLSDIRLGARRNFPKYLMLIDSICLLRQFQKEVKTHENLPYLEVDKEDLKLARKLFAHVADNSMSELNNHSRELLQILQHFNKTSFSRKDIRELTKWSLSKVQRSMTELLKHELLVLETGGRGKVHYYQLIQT